MTVSPTHALTRRFSSLDALASTSTLISKRFGYRPVKNCANEWFAQDAVTRLLIDSAAPTNEIAMALAYEEVCGRARFKEIYRLRPLWALYLAATNVSGRPLALSGIEGETDTPRDVSYRPLGHRLSRENGESSLPAAPLPQGATLLAPIATLLGPMANINPVTLSEKREDLQVVNAKSLRIRTSRRRTKKPPS
jgi:hypothetical protein